MANALLQLSGGGEDKPYLNYAIPVLKIGPGNRANDAETIDGKKHTVSEVLITISLRLPPVSKEAKALVIEPTTAKLRAKQSKDPLCRQLL